MPIIIIPIIVIIVLLVLGYTKAPPNKAAVITGLRDKPKVFLGKAGFKIPFLERVELLKLSSGKISILTSKQKIIFQQKILSISRWMPLHRLP